MIKKTWLVVAMLLVTTSVWAAKTWDVSATTHNLGSTATAATYFVYVATNEDEVCIFCHTPHGGTLNTPLWNRTLPNQGAGSEFSHYTSTTLSTKISVDLSPTRPISAESLLCMSCHDGVVGVGTLVNYSNRTVGNPDNELAKIQPMLPITPGSAIGDSFANDRPTRDLRDDHPISFSYDAVKADVVKGGRLHTVAEAKNGILGVRFFGATNRVECSTCHDPHVNYITANGGDATYAPFLVMPNTGSALCLACHIK